MKKLPKIESALLLYGGTCLAVALLFLALRLALPKESFFYGFFFRCWHIQFLSSWLFMVGVAFSIQRYALLLREEEAYEKVKLPEFTIYREKAHELIKTIPPKYRQTLTLRRFAEILQAMSHGEDIIRLNEELARRDIAEVERGHSVLSTLRSLIPVLGFLGTVVGLSFGMISFPDVTNLEVMRTALKNFAASLSVAFDTTLLALTYTIIIILMTSLLRQREEVLVGKINERTRTLIAKIRMEKPPTAAEQGEGLQALVHSFNQAVRQWKEEFSSIAMEFLDQLGAQNAGVNKQLEGAVRDVGHILSQKLDELKDGIQRPPHYQVIVQPIQKGGNGHESQYR